MPNLANLPVADLQAGTANWSGQGYIEGLKMVWNSATSLSVTSGAAFIPSLSKCLQSPSAITKSGLSLAASTWYHVYLYLNAGVPDIEIVTTAPAEAYNGAARTKTGDSSRRYIGSVRVGAAGTILKFLHNTSNGAIKYLVDLNTADLKLVASGTSVGADTTVSCATAAPVTSRILSGFAENNDTGSGIVYVSNSDAGSPAYANILEFIRSSRTLLGDFAMNASQAITYSTSSAASFSLYATGYVFER